MKSSWKTYLTEGLLIIFSVLFALFINKLFDDFQTHQKKEVALESIQKELSQNAAILESWEEQHRQIKGRVNRIIQGEADSLRNELSKYEYLNFWILSDGKSLVDAVLTNTAWEAAKTSGIISEFDFETTRELTYVYTMQEVLMDKTLAKVLDFFFDTGAHDMDKLDKILIQFQLRFQELVGQENLLIGLYQDVISKLE